MQQRSFRWDLLALERPFIPENSSFSAISLSNSMKKSRGCVQQELCPAVVMSSQGRRKSEAQLPQILPAPQKQRPDSSQALRDRQGARQVHSL